VSVRCILPQPVKRHSVSLCTAVLLISVHRTTRNSRIIKFRLFAERQVTLELEQCGQYSNEATGWTAREP
jgi:hypothetical protein